MSSKYSMRIFRKIKIEYKAFELVVAVAGIIVAGIFAYQQNQINQNLLELNQREQIDFKFDLESSVARIKNYGAGPIYIEAVNVQASSSWGTFPVQQILFSQQELEQNLKNYVESINPLLTDDFYMAHYNLLISSDIKSDRKLKKYKVATMQFGLYVVKGKVDKIIPQFGFSSYYDYAGKVQDFHSGRVR
jgi:hypothetical protein